MSTEFKTVEMNSLADCNVTVEDAGHKAELTNRMD